MFRFALLAVLLAVPATTQRPFELKVEGDKLALSVSDPGIAMQDFVKLAQRVTGHVFIFSTKEMDAAKPVRFIGTMRMNRSEFMPFFQSLLYIGGFTTQSQVRGDSAIIEISSLRDPEDKETSDSKYVIESKLVDYKTSKSKIVTAIELKHIRPEHAVDRLNGVLTALSKDLRLGRASKSVVVQGNGEDVHCAGRMLRLIDVPAVGVIELIRLKHAVASELVTGMKLLLAGQHPAVVVVSHKKANALFISGSRAVVKQAIEIVDLLDRAAKK